MSLSFDERKAIVDVIRLILTMESFISLVSILLKRV